jgi:RND family efflux transporter MFP subunit
MMFNLISYVRTPGFCVALALTIGVASAADGVPKLHPVSTSAATQQVDLSDSAFSLGDQLHGIARPSQMADLPSLVPGTIEQIHIHEGQLVKKGDPLVTLDDRVPKARLAAATVEANLTGALLRAQVDAKMATSRLNRLSLALRQGAGARFELEEAVGVRDQAQAAVQHQQDLLKAAEANRQLAEAQLLQYTISAPFDGVITEIHQKSGTVDPTQVVISLANLETLEVEMHLPSRLYGTFRAEQSVPLRAAAPVSNVIDASVVSVSPIINSASDTFRCLLQINNNQQHLPAGFSVVLNRSDNNATQIGQRQDSK